MDTLIIFQRGVHGRARGKEGRREREREGGRKGRREGGRTGRCLPSGSAGLGLARGWLLRRLEEKRETR